VKKTMTVGILLAAICSPAFAEEITLFSTTYEVQRFDYSSLELFDPITEETAPVIEVEGALYIGDNVLLLSSAAMDFWGVTKNFIISVDLVTDEDGNITGIEYLGNVVVQDHISDDWDLDPCGMTINFGDAGLGAGGGLVVANGETERLTAYRLDGSGLIEFPEGSGCLEEENGYNCGFELNPFNPNLEDVVYVHHLQQLWTIDEEGPNQMDMFSVDGDYAGSFPIGPDTGDPGAGSPKGLVVIIDGETAPADLQGLGDTVIVTTDDNGPGLQVFTLDTEQIDWVPLVDEDGNPLLDQSGCDLPLQIESAAFDQTTGRIFFVQQGDLIDCNYMWVLTPVATPPDYEPGDMNCDGTVDFDDIDAFVLALVDQAGYEEAYPECDRLLGDYDNDGDITFDDIDPFVADLID
jgi:hypothetical protein